MLATTIRIIEQIILLNIVNINNTALSVYLQEKIDEECLTV